MIYDKNSPSYLGQTNDMTKKIVDGFLVEDSIYVVYNLNTEEQFITSHTVQEIEEDADKFMWTPYSIFISRV